MFLLLALTLLDGSQVNLKVKDDVVFDFHTKYGALKVPLKAIRDVNLGIHVDNPEAYIDAAKSLGKEAYKDRVVATKFLKDNPRGGWRYIQSLQKDPDPEVSQRVKQLVDGYTDRPPILDNIATDGSYMAGEIKQSTIEGVSESLGPLKIKISQIKLIVVQHHARSIELDSSIDGWQEVGYIYSGKLTITASGEIDLFPQQPGQYKCSPKGYSTAGKGGSYMAGAIIGRSSDGREFLVEESFSTTSFPRGKLELRIVASPWNNASLGKYQVKID